MNEIYSAIALVLTFVAFIPYLKAALSDTVRPHVFSWIIWGMGTGIVFFAQLSDGAGIGAWPIGISGGITLLVALVAIFKHADTTLTRFDWACLLLSASAIPLWLATSSALSAVLILTAVDLLGFGPTARKSFHVPHEESATFFFVGAVRNGFVLLALEAFTWTTALFPAAVGIACLLFVAMLLVRRTQVARLGPSP